MARGLHPMHLTHAYNLPTVRCGDASYRRRRTTSADALLRELNQCVKCAAIARDVVEAAYRDAEPKP